MPPTAERRGAAGGRRAAARMIAWALALASAVGPVPNAPTARAAGSPPTWKARQPAGSAANSAANAAASPAVATPPAGGNTDSPAVNSPAVNSPAVSNLAPLAAPSDPAAAEPSAPTSNTVAESAAVSIITPSEPSADRTTLRWHARGAAPEAKSTESSTKAAPATLPAATAAKEESHADFPVKQTAVLEPIPMGSAAALEPIPTQAAYAREPAHNRRMPVIDGGRRRGKNSISSSSTRARTRSNILTVAADGADPFRDPFTGDDLQPRSRLKSPPTDTTPVQQPGRTDADLFGEPAAPAKQPEMLEEPTPRVPGGRTESTPPPEPPRSFLEPPQPAQQTPCETDKRECISALGRIKANTINNIALDVRINGSEGRDFPCECTLGNEQFAWRAWGPTIYTFKSSGVCHKPLYFEDVQLERYGHSWNPALQSILSGAHFITCVAFLPYNMAVNPPNECIYTLGYYRPGSCAPYVIEPVPLSLRGAINELGLVATGMWILQLY